jgi:hypothetical protein
MDSMSRPIEEIHRSHNFLELRKSPGLYESIRALAAGELAHFEQAAKLKIYTKDQGAFGAAAISVLFGYLGVPVSYSTLRAALVAADLCSDGRAGTMITNMRRRRDLLPLPSPKKSKGRTVELAASPALEAFVRNRMRVEIAAFARMSPIARAALPMLDTDSQIVKRTILHVGMQLYSALKAMGADANVENFFARRDYGILLVALMILGSEDSLQSKAFPFSLSDAAARLAISRSHVRKTMADGQEAGLVDWRSEERQLRLRAVFIAGLLDHHAIRFLLLAEGLAQTERLAGMALTD